MTSQDKETMNLVYYLEFQIKQSLLDNKPVENFKLAYFDAQYNYLLIQHKLFPQFYNEACTSEEARIITKNSWNDLVN